MTLANNVRVIIRPKPRVSHSQERADKLVTLKVDVYSFGVCLWEIWTHGEVVSPHSSLPTLTGTLTPELPPDTPQAW
jgi:hypothetical protein